MNDAGDIHYAFGTARSVDQAVRDAVQEVRNLTGDNSCVIDEWRGSLRTNAANRRKTQQTRANVAKSAWLEQNGRVGQDANSARSSVAPRFFTLEEVATYLAVSVPQAYALVRSGDLPAIKIGGRGVWRVDRSRLDSYVDRLHKETAAWAKAHPLTTKDAQEPNEAGVD